MKNLSLTTFICLMLIFDLNAQNRTVTGTVEDAQGVPLPGASVLVKDTPLGTITDANGAFNLEIPLERNILIFNFLGFIEQEVEINNQTKLTVILKASTSDLDEILVVGFGTQSKRRVTSSIASVGEEVFENIPVPDFQNALQGRLPGVVITSGSGISNTESSIRIRGVGSISAGNQPLIVVDGLVMSGRINAPYRGDFAGYNTNPFVNINPNDIASVEVLKDAAAAAIYGSRGSNGVILITTKRGDFNSAPKVHIGYQAGFSEPFRTPEYLSGPEYAGLYNRAAAAAGQPTFSDVANQPNSDWFDLTTRKGFLHEATANVSGGTKNTKYYFGGSVKDEQSYLKSVDFQRYSFRANIDQMLGEKVQVGISLNPSRTTGSRASAVDGPIYQANIFAPNIEAFDANGDAVGGFVCNEIDCFPATPLKNLEGTWSDLSSSQVLFNTYINYTLLPNLSLRTSFSTEYTQIKEQFKYGADTWFGLPSGYASNFNQETINYNWTTLATWNNSFAGNHDLEVSAGWNVTKETLNSVFLDGGSFADDRLNFIGSSAQLFSHNSNFTEAGFTGFLARANYAFQNKYLLTVSARYDGSSRFGTANRYGFFPAISAGWILTEEDFIINKHINFLKLRSSFGAAGNAEIGDFASRGLVQFGENYNGEPGYTIRSINNEVLGWEKSVQWDVGLEFALFNNRIRGSLDYYIKDTKDLLLEAPVPATSGITTLSQNAGEVRNQGFEFDLSADIVKGDFSWSVALNGATLKNEVLKLVDANGDGLDDDIYTEFRFLFRPGLSIGTFYLVEYAGVDPNNGDALFWNADKTEKLANQTPSENRRIVGKSLPDFTGGFSSTVRYKNFDLTAFFQFKAGYQMYWFFGQSCLGVDGSFNKIRDCAFDAWTPENTDTNIPEARFGQVNGSQRSSANLYDADYLRLNNLMLGYTIPSFGKNNYSLRIYASAQNLLTFTDFPELDPDGSLYTAGKAEQGGVLGESPAARRFIMGFNLDF